MSQQKTRIRYKHQAPRKNTSKPPPIEVSGITTMQEFEKFLFDNLKKCPGKALLNRVLMTNYVSVDQFQFFIRFSIKTRGTILNLGS